MSPPNSTLLIILCLVGCGDDDGRPDGSLLDASSQDATTSDAFVGQDAGGPDVFAQEDASTEDAALVDTARPDSGMPGCAPTFFDDFEYAVTSVADMTARGWSGAKATNLTGSHRGTLMTDDGALRFDLEGEAGQTDVWAELSAIPADVTFEFDLFVEENADGIHRRFKFLYPSVDGSYPQSISTIRWILSLSPNNISPESVTGSGRELYLRLALPQNLWVILGVMEARTAAA